MSDFIVHRRLRMQRPEQLSAAADLLAALPGVERVKAQGSALKIHYDNSLIGFRQLLQALRSADLAPAAGPGSRLRSAWYGYLDANARANAGAAGACCSSPKDIYASRRSR